MVNKPKLQHRSAQATVLVVENDVGTALPLVFGLQDQGFWVLHASDGRQGLELARAAQPDLVLLDVALPQMEGFTLCYTLRRASAVPIILLTDSEREGDRIKGLELGADSYMVKPISFRELMARVRALLRRRKLARGYPFPHNGRTVVGDIVLDRSARKVWRGDRLITLRRLEFELLCALMENAGSAIPRHELMDQVWGEDWVGDPRTLDVHIRWLRTKVEDDPSAPQYIQTVHGYGHRFVDPNGAPVEAN